MKSTIELINFLHEVDLLEVHLEEHSKFIDKIVVIESEVTYSGMPKPLYFEENKERFSRFNVIHEVIPSDLFIKIPSSYKESEHKKWMNSRRENRETQQSYIFNKYRKEADYVCNTDTDEIWSVNRWQSIVDLMEEDYCYIIPKCRRFFYFIDFPSRIDYYYRISRSDMDTHVRQKGFKRGSTNLEVGWHFSTCFKDPVDIWMKGVGIAQSIGYLGWENVPTPKECSKMINSGILPFLNQKINPYRGVMSKDNLSWLPTLMQKCPDKYPWLDEKYRNNKSIFNWRLN